MSQKQTPPSRLEAAIQEAYEEAEKEREQMVRDYRRKNPQATEAEVEEYRASLMKD
jgi:t-SNARE complex subunit (syntaxin)